MTKRQPSLKKKVAILIFTAIILWLSWSLYQSGRNFQQTTKVLQQKKAALEKQRNKLAELKKKLNLAEQEFTKEKLIRDELLLQKPGEKIIQVSLPKDNLFPTAPPTPSPNNWRLWWRALKN